MKLACILSLVLIAAISIQGADKKTSPKNATKTLVTTNTAAAATTAITAAATTTQQATASKPCGQCVKCRGICGRCNIYPCYKDQYGITYGLCSGCMLEKGYEQA